MGRTLPDDEQGGSNADSFLFSSGPNGIGAQENAGKAEELN
jgi:hypothetical protein